MLTITVKAFLLVYSIYCNNIINSTKCNLIVSDLDKLINRNRRPGLKEVCSVYEADVPDTALIDENEDILNYDDVDDPDAFV